MMQKLAASAAALFFSLSTIGPAGAGDALSLADGKEWSMTNQNGRSGRMMLKRDGTGTMRMGLFSLGMTWWANPPDELCIDNARTGTRCVQLVAVAGGFDGVSNGEVVMTLRR